MALTAAPLDQERANQLFSSLALAKGKAHARLLRDLGNRLLHFVRFETLCIFGSKESLEGAQDKSGVERKGMPFSVVCHVSEMVLLDCCL